MPSMVLYQPNYLVTYLLRCKEKASTRFTIGPVFDRDFWNKERSKIDIDRGPCTLPTRLLGLSADKFHYGRLHWTMPLPLHIEKSHGSITLLSQERPMTRL